MKAFLVDFDGTLASVDEKTFTEQYFSQLKAFAQERFSVAISPEQILRCVEHITRFADGKVNNYDRFLSCFQAESNLPDVRTIFNEFYLSASFDTLKRLVKPNYGVVEVLKRAKQNGLITVLATNPVFPKVAVVKRLGWINLKEEDFDLITHMENFHFCKPDPRYYLEICSTIKVKPEDCMMIGNDELLDRACEQVKIRYTKVQEIGKIQLRG
ncbi:HAD family hydrolase [Pseudothermotoga sp. U03pept]|uniref:HAD family hydrolase n=1 Tax=Pseudothermotoga sp. U03pept TaxID=3447012 RepID=UPI003EFD86C7